MKGRVERGFLGHILVMGGGLLLVGGSVLVSPYLRSRLETPPSSSASSPLAAAPVPVEPSQTPTIVSVLPSRVPATSTPTPTPTPAVPSHVVIPAIGVDAPVTAVSVLTTEVNGQTTAIWDVPAAYAAGWHESSAPLGVPGNTVLNGHNTTNGEVFRDLYTLEVGDEIIVCSGSVTFTYAISEVLILPEAGQPLEVRLENAQYIMPTSDERLTLVTCHPYGSIRNRLIVIALPSAPTVPAVENETPTPDD